MGHPRQDIPGHHIQVSHQYFFVNKHWKMMFFREGGMLPKDVYNLNLYERNVQVVGLRSIDAPILLDTVRTALPEGVTMTMQEHTRDVEEERWISDPVIDSLRTELESKDEEKAAAKLKSEAKLEAKAQRKKEMLLKNLQEED